jgi:transmembrane sensor
VTQDRDEAITRFAKARGKGQAGTDEVGALWRDLDQVAEHPAIRTMRQQALERLDAPKARPAWRLPAMAALAATLVVAVGLGLSWHAAPPVVPPEPEQVLSNGQQMPREVALADGTHITLDSHTQMHLAANGRQVRLDYGRAFFNVRHDEARPFSVSTGDMTVNDIGTRFEVRREESAIAVTLVEGKVRVARGGVSTDMVPGSRLTLKDGRQSVVMLDAGRKTLWQSGMISADDVPVRDIVAQYNRYLAHPLVLRDPAMGALRISGEFRLDDPQGFLDAMTAMGAAHP